MLSCDPWSSQFGSSRSSSEEWIGLSEFNVFFSCTVDPVVFTMFSTKVPDSIAEVAGCRTEATGYWSLVSDS